MHSSVSFCFIGSSAFILALCTSRCNGRAIDRAIILTRSPSSDDTQTEQCGFSGNSDVLGVGIRVGYYTQALSVWFANYYVPGEAKGLRSINLLFLVALFIGLVWLTHQNEQTHAIEVYLLLRLLFATWYVGVIDRSRFSKKQWRKSYARVIVRECSLMGLLAYTVWFAWVGLDRLKETPCGTFVFFAIKVNLYGVYRDAFKALSISALSFGTIKQLDTIVQLLQRWQNSSIGDPSYYPRLQQSLLASNAKNVQSQTPELVILDAAIQKPLPESPTCDASVQSATNIPVATSQNSRSSSPDSSGERSFPSLNDLITAEEYLKSIIEIDLRDHSQWCYVIKWIPLRVFLPSIHSPATLRRRISSLYACRPFRLAVLIPLFRHIKSLCRFPLYSYAFMIEAALLSPLHKQISTKTLIPALALHKAHLPPHRPTPNVVYHAVASLLMYTELVLNIELSIHWNRITGMSNIGAIGQLIPAIIGVGGLVRVIWVWWSKGDNRRNEEIGIDVELKECAEVYQRLKKEKENPSKTHEIVVAQP